jgi:hypothetical protein
MVGFGDRMGTPVRGPSRWQTLTSTNACRFRRRPDGREKCGSREGTRVTGDRSRLAGDALARAMLVANGPASLIEVDTGAYPERARSSSVALTWRLVKQSAAPRRRLHRVAGRDVDPGQRGGALQVPGGLSRLGPDLCRHDLVRAVES